MIYIPQISRFGNTLLRTLASKAHIRLVGESYWLHPEVFEQCIECTSPSLFNGYISVKHNCDGCESIYLCVSEIGIRNKPEFSVYYNLMDGRKTMEIYSGGLENELSKLIEDDVKILHSNLVDAVQECFLIEGAYKTGSLIFEC